MTFDEPSSCEGRRRKPQTAVTNNNHNDNLQWTLLVVDDSKMTLSEDNDEDGGNAAGCSSWYQKPEIGYDSSASDILVDEVSEKKRFKQRRFKLVPIIRAELISTELPLIEYHTIKVERLNLIGKLLPLLPPLEADANHLKRIKDGKILVQPYSQSIPDELIERLREYSDHLSFGNDWVPSRKPNTRAQFIWAKKYWPTCFHPDKKLERLLSDEYFSADEQKQIVEFYLQADAMAGDSCSCVMVDPSGTVLVRSISKSVPLGHAVMLAVRDLSARQCAERQKRLEDSNCTFRDSSQYLGNEFDVYLSDEPCAMCAMALVHFRVRRVFFGRRSTSCGVYESCWRIQEEKSLNHHYQVFRIDEID